MARTAAPTPADVDADVASALAWLKKRGTKATRDGMARYAIRAGKAFGVPVGDLRRLARSSECAAIWPAAVEDRLVRGAHAGGFVDDPALVTPAQMDRWCRDFDNWAICDHGMLPAVRSHAARLEQGRRSGRRKVAEFVRRAAFALLASVALHDKRRRRRRVSCDRCRSSNARPTTRNFVKKGVSWALRCSAGATSSCTPPVALAERLAASNEAGRALGREGRAARSLASTDRGARPEEVRGGRGAGCEARQVTLDQRPPVTSMNVPVVYEDSSDSSHRIACATSSGCPPRFIGTNAFTRSTRSGSPPLAWISV